jgi:hypothetical protein
MKQTITSRLDRLEQLRLGEDDEPNPSAPNRTAGNAVRADMRAAAHRRHVDPVRLHT